MTMAMMMVLWGGGALGDQAVYWTSAAVSCVGTAACAENVPGCGAGGCGNQAVWSISTPPLFGGPYTTKAVFNPTTESDVAKNGGNSDWIIFTGFEYEYGEAPQPNSTILGMQLAVYLNGKVDLYIPADALRVRFPDGSFHKRVNNNLRRDMVGSAIPMQVPLDTDSPDKDLWQTTSGQNLTTFDWTNPNFGFALFGANTNGKNQKLTFFTASIRVFSVKPGQVFVPPPPTTAPPTTAPPPPGPPIGIIVGAIVGGLLVVGGLVLLIIYLVRRAAVAQPSIRLDAPLSAPYEQF